MQTSIGLSGNCSHNISPTITMQFTTLHYTVPCPPLNLRLKLSASMSRPQVQGNVGQRSILLKIPLQGLFTTRKQQSDSTRVTITVRHHTPKKALGTSYIKSGFPLLYEITRTGFVRRTFSRTARSVWVCKMHQSTH